MAHPNQPSSNQPATPSQDIQAAEGQDESSSSLHMRPNAQDCQQNDQETPAPSLRHSSGISNLRETARQQERHYLGGLDAMVMDGRLFDEVTDPFADADMVPAHHIHIERNLPQSHLSAQEVDALGMNATAAQDYVQIQQPSPISAGEASNFFDVAGDAYGSLASPPPPVMPLDPAPPTPPAIWVQIATEQDRFNFERYRALCVRHGRKPPPSLPLPPSNDGSNRGRRRPREASWRYHHPGAQ